MKTKPKDTPNGHVIFCDDIRKEVGNKPSYIGIYTGAINFPSELPSQLPKFAFAIVYSERPGESTEPVTLSVFLPGDADDAPTINENIPVEQMRSQPPPPDIDFDDPVISALMHLVIAPFKVEKEGVIKVRAYRGDLEIKLGAIHVLSRPRKESTDSSG